VATWKTVWPSEFWWIPVCWSCWFKGNGTPPQK